MPPEHTCQQALPPHTMCGPSCQLCPEVLCYRGMASPDRVHRSHAITGRAPQPHSSTWLHAKPDPPPFLPSLRSKAIITLFVVSLSLRLSSALKVTVTSLRSPNRSCPFQPSEAASPRHFAPEHRHQPPTPVSHRLALDSHTFGGASPSSPCL
jgi:hypothetical protein